MRISVECGGFTQAADACLTANHIAAVLTQSLGSRLAGTGSMAGDDATSAAFSTAYDASAGEALGTLVDLTHSFSGLGRLLTTTGANHLRAEAGAARAAYDDSGSLDDGAFARIEAPSPPSSLGAQEPSLGVVDAWILDQVEGFVWPGADVTVLRDAASAWRRAAASTAGTADHVDAAITLVEAQHSPEVPLAVDALTELATLVGDAAWHLSNVATACEEYADAVETARDRTRALLAEVAQMIVEGAAISVLVAGLSGGLGGGAAAAAAAARVRAVAPRFYALLVSLRAGAASAAARLERAGDELSAVRAKLEKFVRVPARDEAGTLRSPGGWPGSRRPGWLKDHEAPPGHTVERHVGKSAEYLADRCRAQSLAKASSFTDQRQAEKLIESTMQRHRDAIEGWRASGSNDKLELSATFDRATGLTVDAAGNTSAPSSVRVVLVPSKTQPAGWQILTAFPY